MSPRGSLSSETASIASPDPVDTVRKKFSCTWPGCGKTFSRSEHLHRHALNHKDGNNTCPRCSTHFRRRDLLGIFDIHCSFLSFVMELIVPLDRHMNRHKEKDAEAGGEGLGHLATRKRLWRDASGNIVNTRRPYHQEGSKRRQLPSNEESVKRSDHQQVDSLKSQTVGGPPPLTPMANKQHGGVEQFGGNKVLQDNWEADMNPVPSDWACDPSNFLLNADWGRLCQNDSGTSGDLPDDDIFKPDSGKSLLAIQWRSKGSLNSNNDRSYVIQCSIHYLKLL